MMATRSIFRSSRLLINQQSIHSKNICNFYKIPILSKKGLLLKTGVANFKILEVANISDEPKKEVTFSQKGEAKCEVKTSMKDKLKKAVAEYGTTVIVFHVTISMMSLGLCYLLVSNGLDVDKFFAYFNIQNKVTSGAGLFVAAYAIHKCFSPVRIAITLGSTPFIVRYLRSKGILKAVKTN